MHMCVPLNRDGKTSTCHGHACTCVFHFSSLLFLSVFDLSLSPSHKGTPVFPIVIGGLKVNNLGKVSGWVSE